MKKLPFRWKLTLLIMLTSGVTLGIAFAGLYIYDAIQFRGEMQRRVDSTRKVAAEVLIPRLASGEPMSADAFEDMFMPDHQIAAAAVYSPDGKLLARYIRMGSNEFIPRLSDISRIFGADLNVVLVPLRTANGTTLGTLYIKAGVSDSDKERFDNLLRGVGIVFLVSVLFAFIVAYRVQGTISKPITALAAAALRISRDRDYSLRVVGVNASGEIGSLVESFNSMVQTIANRSQELEFARSAAEEAREKTHFANLQLEEANQTLEDRVEERTRALAEASHAADEASRSKSAFLAKMSHELRTPLNAIIGYSEMMLEDAVDAGNTTTADDHKKVLGAARHLLGLINDVLDISKIEAGRMELYVQTFEIETLIRDVASTVSPLVEQKGNTLYVECPPDIGLMQADSTKLRQIILNLLSNAVKFTEKGGITLAVERLPDGQTLSIKVSDTGIGMTPEHMSRLFQAFSQADASTSSKYGGTGLGLAISRQFAQLMGGNVTVDSTQGVGTTFTILLPLQVQSLELKKEPEPVEASEGTETILVGDELVSHSPKQDNSDNFDVLLVEDDPPTREMMRRILERREWRIHAVANGQLALKAIERHVPAAVVLDLKMPIMNGFQFLDRVRVNPIWKDIPVFVFTSMDVTHDIRERLTSCSAGIFQKGNYSREELLQRVHDAVQDHLSV